MAPYTTPEQLDAAHSTLHKTFKSGKTKSIAWRKWQLKQIWWMMKDNKNAMIKALHADLNRHEYESLSGEIRLMEEDVLAHLQHVDEWAADEFQDAGLLFGTLAGARIRKEPLGVALIIAPWNFPLCLLVGPMIAAVSAGCCVMLKPSELAIACQDLFVEIIPKYLDQDAIQVVTGAAQETSVILTRRFDHIFYTGSANIAKIVSAAAAKYLTPTVLELGGQSACVVTASANVNLAAKRIVFSKYLNAGQVCLSGNHVFVDPSVHDEFIEKASYWIGQFVKDEGKDHAVRIVNERNYDRLVGLLKQTGGKIVSAGINDRENKYIPPTIVSDVTMQGKLNALNLKISDCTVFLALNIIMGTPELINLMNVDPLMSEEIFGPLLPIVKAGYRQACEIMQKMEHPLGLYIFSTDKNEIDEILLKTSSGGVTINDVMLHANVPNTPFGGVGNSGSGAYHGKYGFEAFTHKRAVVPIPSWFEYLLSIRYPPYDMKHVSKFAVKNPSFKRGETMQEQKVESSMATIVPKLLGTSAKWAAVAVIFALVDAKMGGKPKLLEMLGGLRSTLPV